MRKRDAQVLAWALRLDAADTADLIAALEARCAGMVMAYYDTAQGETMVRLCGPAPMLIGLSEIAMQAVGESCGVSNSDD